MSWSLVPLLRRDFGFFDRQRDLFSQWVKEFNADWHSLRSDESLARFDRELEQLRKDLFQLEPDPSMLHVENPFVTDASGNRKLSLRFDCSKFKPEEVTVKTVSDKVCVHAKHDEESGGRKVHREFRREYILPEKVDAHKLKSTLSKDGVLMIEGPAPASINAPKENLVPIEML